MPPTLRKKAPLPRKAKTRRPTSRTEEVQRIEKIEAKATLTAWQEIAQVYGFVGNHLQTPRHNAAIYFANLPLWYFWERPLNTACHDLTTTTRPPRNLQSLLGLGLKFFPRPRETTRNIDSSIHRFTCSAKVKHFYGNNKPDPLFDPRTHVPSEWEPRDTQCNTEYIIRISAFTRKMINLHQRRQTSSNLLLYQ
jgi:hypothetical protein